MRSIQYTRALSWMSLWLIVPLLAVLTGCDSGGSNGEPSTPEASFTTSIDQLTVSFTDESTAPDGGSIVSWSWEFGDGEDSNDENPSHTYAEPGDYDVTLTVTDNEGRQDEVTETITVDPNQIVVSNNIEEDVTWTADRTYILDGLIFVNPGVTLTIEPGTVVKARAQSEINSGDGASALIVRRGAKLMADGTAQDPIIFTSTQDDVENPDDLSAADRGLWGGVILLGNAPTSEPQSVQIEGIPDTENALFGGDDADDNSGVLRYVSIRHGGFSISGVSGDEINGLTLGGVGRGTTIEYVEVFANVDDGFEWFGGTVHAKNLVAAFCGDDSFDWDTGFRGTGQYWFSIQAADQAGRAGEHDGYDTRTSENEDEYSDPVVTNVTYIGSGSSASPGGDNNDPTLRIRARGAGEYYNSIFTAFPNEAIRIDDDGSDELFNNGQVNILNNVFWDYGAGDDISSIVRGDQFDAQLDADNAFQDPALAGISRAQDGGLDPRPSATDLPAALAKSEFVNSSESGSDDYPGVDLSEIEDVSYLGAFDPNGTLWISGWTKLSQDGYAAE